MNSPTRSFAHLSLASLLFASLAAAQSLAPSVAQIAFDGVAAGSAAQTRSLSVAVTGGTPSLTLTATASTTTGGNWLSISPGSVPNPGASVPFTVSANPSGLAAGSYAGQISFAMPPAAAVTVAVSMTITASGGGGGSTTGLLLSPTSLSLSSTVGGQPLQRTISVGAPTGSAPLSFTATANSQGNWLSVSPGSASTPAQIQVTASPAALTAGTYNGTVTFTPTGSTTGVPLNVTLTIGSGGSTQGPLTAAPANLTFTVAPNSGPSAIQTVVVSASSALLTNLTIAATTATGGNWLTVAPLTGSAPLSLSVSVNPLSLTAGTYNGSIGISVSGSTDPPLAVPVTLTVQGSTQPSTLQANPSTLTFSIPATGNRSQSQTIAVTAQGGAVVSVSAAVSGGAWITVNPSTSSTPATFTASVNAFGLAEGSYQATITLSSTGVTPLTIPVTMTVGTGSGGGAGQFELFPSSIGFDVQSGRPLPGARFVTATGGSGAFTATATTSAGGSWLQVSPGSGNLPGVVLVRLVDSVVSLLSAGTYNGTVSIASQGTGAQTRTVDVRLTVGTGAVLTSNAPPLLFTVAANGSAPGPVSFSVDNSGTASVPVQVVAAVQSGSGWLTVNSSSQSTPAPVTVTVNPVGLAAGRYDGTVTISSSQSGVASLVLPVRVIVVSGSLVTISANQVSFSSTGGAVPSPVNVSLGSLTGTAQYTAAVNVISPTGGTWLSVQPTSGTLPGNITISASPTGLATGDYAGTVTITVAGAANSPAIIPVLFSVTSTTPAGLVATPASLTFTQAPGAAAPSPQTLQLTAPSSTSFTATAATSSGGSWLTVNPASGQVPGSVSVVISNTASLTAGTYSGSVTLTSSAGNVTVPVTLTIGASSPFVAAPAQLSFTATPGGSNPAGQTIQLSAAGASAAQQFTVTVATQSGGNWLTVTPSAGTTPAPLQAAVTLGSLAAGTYSGSITVSAQSLQSLVIPVTLTVGSGGPGGGGGGTPAVTSVVHSATQLSGTVSPGLIVFIRGSGLGPAQQARFQLDAQGRVPTTVSGVRVTFGGIAAPLLAVQQDAISAIVPWAMAGRASAPLVVEYNGVASASTTLTVADTAPGIFTMSGTGSGQGAILNQDLTLNSSQNPAARGSIGVLYITGDGALTPQGADGEVASPGQTRRPVQSIQLRIGGIVVPASGILYGGSAPGLVLGVGQVNFVIPNTVTPGAAVTVEVAVGGTTSAGSATMAIQ